MTPQPLHVSMNKKTSQALAVVVEHTGLSFAAAARYSIVNMAEAMKTAHSVGRVEMPEQASQAATQEPALVDR